MGGKNVVGGEKKNKEYKSGRFTYYLPEDYLSNNHEQESNPYYSTPTDTSKEYYDSLFSARENARANKYGEPIDTTESGGQKIFVMTPENFKSVNDARMNNLAKLREQYSEGENSQEQQMSFLDTASKLPFSRQVVAPMLEEANRNDNVHPVAKGISTIVHGLLNSVMTPYTEGTELVNKALENVNYTDPILNKKVNLGQEITGGINRTMNLPFEAVKTASKGYNKIFDMAGIKLPEIVNKETDQKLGDLATEIGTLYLLGKGHSALKDYVNKKVSIPELKELQNGKENNATSEISPIEREPVIGGTKEQTEIGTPQRGSENIPQEKTPQALKWIEKENKNIVGEQNGKGIKLTLPNGEEKIFVMGEGSHKDPMAMAYRYIADDLMNKGLDQTNAEVFAEDFISQAAVNDKMNIGDVTNGKFKSTWDKGETKSLVQDVETQQLPKGDFGTIYNQFKGKPQEAVEHLMNVKEGEVPGALSHKNIGDIDLVWGEEGTRKSDGYGLAKIAKYHPEVLDNLQDSLDNMEIKSISNNRIKLESPSHEASVSLKWFDKDKTWLLTEYEKKAGGTMNVSGTEQKLNPVDRTTPLSEDKTTKGEPQSQPLTQSQKESIQSEFDNEANVKKLMDIKPVGEEASRPAKQVKVNSLKTVEGTGEKKQRGLGKSTEARAIETGILDEIKNLPEYNTLKNDVEIPKASKLIYDTPQKALNIVNGTEKAPSLPQLGFIYSGLRNIAESRTPVPEPVKNLPQYKGLSDLEIKADLANNLANSDYVSKQGTTAGQFIQSLKGQNDLSTVKAIEEIKKVRENAFLEKTKRTDINVVKERVTSQIKNQITKNNLQFRDWNSFIDSLVCK
jgi:hypothetical protein